MGLAHALHSLAVTLHIMSPALYNPDAGKREAFSIALLNSLTLAVACRCPHCKLPPLLRSNAA